MERADQSRPGHGERILVVDDVRTNVKLLQSYLGSIGYEVLTAGDGREALASLAETPPDLVLLDVMMPELDGFEACARIKQDERTRHIPVILLTSLNALEDKVKGQEAGADDFVTKPFDRGELLLRVKSMLRMKALHDQLAQKVGELEGAKRRLKRLADTDGLTLLYNKRYLDDRLHRELCRAERYEHPLSILMLDIDHFKRFNDRFGHPSGDALLKQLATLFTRSIRNIDLAARYGGEEFSLVLPETPAAGAAVVARRLNEQVRLQRFRDARGELIGTVTVSIGVATYPEDAPDAARLVEVADQRLYAAKQGGRNQVVLSDPVSA